MHRCWVLSGWTWFCKAPGRHFSQRCTDVSQTGRETPQIKKAPRRPTEEEVQEHNVCHIPFRAWCPHCVKGKAMNDPHMRDREEVGEFPTVSIDYCFLHIGEGEEMERLSSEVTRTNAGMPIVVTTDDKTGLIFADVVPRKGNDPYAIKRVGQNVRLLGYSKVLILSLIHI